MSDRGAWPSVGALILGQVRHQVRLFLRVPIGLFFTIALPLIMLVVFNAVFGDSTVASPAGEWPTRQFYTGALAAFTAVSATYTNLANTVPVRREDVEIGNYIVGPSPPRAKPNVLKSHEEMTPAELEEHMSAPI